MVIEHWSEDRYWKDATERFAELRQQGLSKLVLDLDAIESEIFSGDSPAYWSWSPTPVLIRTLTALVRATGLSWLA